MLRWLFIFILIYDVCVGQTVINGKVINKKNGEPIPFVNIGIPGVGVGTVSDTQGVFILEIPERLKNEKLIFSHVNFGTIRLELKSLIQNSVIELMPVVQTLNEITVRGTIRDKIGYLPEDASTFGFFKVKGLGGEGGVIIHNEDTLKLVNFFMNVINNPFEKVTFRLNVYDVKSNMPSKKLNAHDIIFDIPGGFKGSYSVALGENAIVVTEDFVVAVEVIGYTKPKSESDVLYISAFQDKNVKAYRRTVSHCNWERFNSAGICFWLDVEKD